MGVRQGGDSARSAGRVDPELPGHRHRDHAQHRAEQGSRPRPAPLTSPRCCTASTRSSTASTKTHCTPERDLSKSLCGVSGGRSAPRAPKFVRETCAQSSCRSGSRRDANCLGRLDSAVVDLVVELRTARCRYLVRKATAPPLAPVEPPTTTPWEGAPWTLRSSIDRGSARRADLDHYGRGSGDGGGLRRDLPRTNDQLCGPQGHGRRHS